MTLDGAVEIPRSAIPSSLILKDAPLEKVVANTVVDQMVRGKIYKFVGKNVSTAGGIKSLAVCNNCEENDDINYLDYFQDADSKKPHIIGRYFELDGVGVIVPYNPDTREQYFSFMPGQTYEMIKLPRACLD